MHQYVCYGMLVMGEVVYVHNIYGDMSFQCANIKVYSLDLGYHIHDVLR